MVGFPGKRTEPDRDHIEKWAFHTEGLEIIAHMKSQLVARRQKVASLQNRPVTPAIRVQRDFLQNFNSFSEPQHHPQSGSRAASENIKRMCRESGHLQKIKAFPVPVASF